MKKQLSLFVGLFLLFIPGAHASAPLGDTGKIAGRVVDAISGEPLIGVNVVLSLDGENTITGTVTDVDGYYSMINIKPGTYQLRFSYIGYQAQRT